MVRHTRNNDVYLITHRREAFKNLYRIIAYMTNQDVLSLQRFRIVQIDH